ncbi:hypothetical protein AB0L13_20190 [Saccharopolyspora shandongensis]|uniref:hypothetical protein n=1 Tax=Saccharopolyspora shandongensis TaxID=418495 RepID=UPI0034186391
MNQHGLSLLNRHLSRADRLNILHAQHPDAPACRHCESPIRPHRNAPQVWEHITTGLPRCVGTDQAEIAAPLDDQMHLFPVTRQEAA